MRDSDRARLQSKFRALEMFLGAVSGLVIASIVFGKWEQRSPIWAALAAVVLIGTILAMRRFSSAIQAKKAALLGTEAADATPGDLGRQSLPTGDGESRSDA